MGKRKVSNPKQDRKFEVILYPDSTSYDFADVITRLQDYFDMWAWLVHDKDIDSDTGELKKPHCHFAGTRPNAVSIQTVANAAGVPANYVKFGITTKGVFRYLVHADSPAKYQYDFTNVVANFDYPRYCNLLKDSDYARRIIRYIVDNRVITTKQLAQWCLDNDCWSEFRRAYRIWYDIMFELRNVPMDKLPASFTENSDNPVQEELSISVEHPNGLDPQLRK